jgi:dTDP-4-dehydrorhamnose 3,5-epimerase
MRLVKIPFEGVFGILPDTKKDSRGSLDRIFDSDIPFTPSQMSLVRNTGLGILRGLHFQTFPFAEQKAIICAEGTIFDVIVNIDPVSQEFGKYYCVEIGPESEFIGLLISSTHAHGYLTLTEQSEIIYIMDKPFQPQFSKGIIWSDPTIQIPWPSLPKLVSDRDSVFPTLQTYFGDPSITRF